MTKDWKTQQEAFWAGDFGSAYNDRNVGETLLASKTALLADILRRTREVGSIVEFGANIGLNLVALRRLAPEADFAAIEINPDAARTLRELGWVKTHEGSILESQVEQPSDLVLIAGVLIHINPDMLPAVYDQLYAASSRYVCLAQYYNPSPVAVSYRGHSERLFKRDFTGEMLDRFPDLKLLDYGFAYHRDPVFPADDLTGFVLEKSS